MEAFTASIDVDSRLYRHDIAGSIAGVVLFLTLKPSVRLVGALWPESFEEQASKPRYLYSGASQDPDTALDLIVYDGRVRLTPPAGSPPPPADVVTTGQRLTVARDGAAAVDDLDPVEGYSALRLAGARDLAWTLYYPPIVGPGTAGGLTGALPVGSAEAAEAFRRAFFAAAACLGIALVAVIMIEQRPLSADDPNRKA